MKTSSLAHLCEFMVIYGVSSIFTLSSVRCSILGWSKKLGSYSGSYWGAWHTHKTPTQDNQCPGQGSNLEPLEGRSSWHGVVFVGCNKPDTFTFDRFPIKLTAVPTSRSIATNDVSTYFFFCDIKKTYKGKNKREMEMLVSQRVSFSVPVTTRNRF
jgi:hypothetical protein